MAAQTTLRRAAALGVAAAFLLTGCSGDGDDSATDPTSPGDAVTDEATTDQATDESTDEATDEATETTDEPAETTDEATETTAETSDDATTETDAAAPSHTDPAARAAQGALAAEPDSAVLSIDPETGDEWEVLVRRADGSGAEIYVNAQSGETLRERAAQVPAAAADAAPQFTAVEAIDVALGAVPDGAIRELDIDTEAGVVVWEILVGGGGGATEFYIDATTGDIVKQESAGR